MLTSRSPCLQADPRAYQQIPVLTSRPPCLPADPRAYQQNPCLPADPVLTSRSPCLPADSRAYQQNPCLPADHRAYQQIPVLTSRSRAYQYSRYTLHMFLLLLLYSHWRIHRNRWNIHQLSHRAALCQFQEWALQLLSEPGYPAVGGADTGLVNLATA